MSRNSKNEKHKKAKHSQLVSPVAVGEKVRIALRSIVWDWQSLRAPLPVDPMPSDVPGESPRYRVRGDDSYEEIQERVIEFAGRVWQLKDGLIKWLENKPSLHLNFSDDSGRTVAGAASGRSRRVECAPPAGAPRGTRTDVQ